MVPPLMQRIGIDTGGTFTDAVLLVSGKVRVDKLPSTPADPAQAVLDLLATLRKPGRKVDVVHGTTVGLNAILTGNTARIAFITNAGFRDLIEIGRQDRQGIYDLQATHAELPVARNLRFEVNSRRSAAGEILAEPKPTELRALIAKLRRARVEAIAIGLLHSYAYPQDELALAKALQVLDLPVSCSGQLLAIPGEFERFSTVILNAAIKPIMGDYLARLQGGVVPGRLRMMRSSGGIMSADEASNSPARAVFSGPAGGVLASERLADALAEDHVAALDMGGTSTDVCLVGEDNSLDSASKIAGLPLAIPSVGVHTIGCGGGSIAYADAGGALRVGPMSAGADPGPACYGRGEQPTVTDAHLALGHLGADTLLGGAFPVDPDRSVRAIEGLADKLGMANRACAEGIIEIAEVAIMRALMVITVERSIDPASIPLIAYGGAAGLHAAALIDRLDMPWALVPAHAGAFSALGLALAGESQEVSLSVLRPLEALPQKRLRAWMDELRRRAEADLEPGSGRRSFRGKCLLRFRGQGAGLWLPWCRDLAEAFRKSHQLHFGFLPDSRAIELVEMSGRTSRAGRPFPAATEDSRNPPQRGTRRRRARIGGPGVIVYQRQELGVGDEISGPATIEDFSSTCLIPRGFQCRVAPHGLQLLRAV